MTTTTATLSNNTLNPANTRHTIADMWLGVFWKVISFLFFASANAIVRYLTGGSPIHLDQPLPVYTIMFCENMIGTLFLLCIFCHLNTKVNVWQQLFTIPHFSLHLTRVALAALGVGLWYLSLRYMPVTEVLAISFIVPMFTIIGAVLLLRERLTWQRIITISLSLIGGFFIARPDLKFYNSTLSWIIVLPLLATLIFAADKILVRKLFIAQAKPMLLTFLLIFFMGIFSLTPCLIYGWETPSAQHWPWLILLGLLSLAAHFSFSKAYRYAEVTALLPYGITKVVFAGCVSYLAFNEYPQTVDLWIGIIVLTCCSLLYKYKPETKPTKPAGNNDIANNMLATAA